MLLSIRLRKGILSKGDLLDFVRFFSPGAPVCFSTTAVCRVAAAESPDIAGLRSPVMLSFLLCVPVHDSPQTNTTLCYYTVRTASMRQTEGGTDRETIGLNISKDRPPKLLMLFPRDKEPRLSVIRVQGGCVFYGLRDRGDEVRPRSRVCERRVIPPA